MKELVISPEQAKDIEDYEKHNPYPRQLLNYQEVIKDGRRMCAPMMLREIVDNIVSQAPDSFYSVGKHLYALLDGKIQKCDKVVFTMVLEKVTRMPLLFIKSVGRPIGDIMDALRYHVPKYDSVKTYEGKSPLELLQEEIDYIHGRILELIRLEGYTPPPNGDVVFVPKRMIYDFDILVAEKLNKHYESGIEISWLLRSENIINDGIKASYPFMNRKGSKLRGYFIMIGHPKKVTDVQTWRKTVSPMERTKYGKWMLDVRSTCRANEITKYCLEKKKMIDSIPRQNYENADNGFVFFSENHKYL